jgi:flagellar protein FlbD
VQGERLGRVPHVPRERKDPAVITVTRLDGAELVVNAELIELVEATPDTHLTLIDGRRLIVKEPTDEVVARVIAYRRAAYGPLSAIKVAS